jgi:serine/threonine protein kinase
VGGVGVLRLRPRGRHWQPLASCFAKGGDEIRKGSLTYKVEKLLGKGNYGKVYAGQCQGVLVAIKRFSKKDLAAKDGIEVRTYAHTYGHRCQSGGVGAHRDVLVSWLVGSASGVLVGADLLIT